MATRALPGCSGTRQRELRQVGEAGNGAAAVPRHHLGIDRRRLVRVRRMTRAEIGSFLGLKLETVSRVLSRFAQDELIDVNQKHVRIINPDGLREIVSGQTS